MNDDEAVAEFRKLMDAEGWDKENAHGLADAFMARVLRENGFPNLADEYEKPRGWWYA